jgi:hypothetical protein
MRKMKKQLRLAMTLLPALTFGLLSMAHADECWSPPADDLYSFETVGDSPTGNHELDCTIIRPWSDTPESSENQRYPVIGWANGWGGNENAGENEIAGYLPGLIDWAVDGQFIVVAANQWSPRERDVLQCVSWLLEQDTVKDSEYNALINTNKVGLVGHSQGGGAVLRSSDGQPKGKGLRLDLEITTVVAMNPYGPSWSEVNPDGPVLIVGGALDTTTPPEKYEKAWQLILAGNHGGVNATELAGTHNNNAWAKVGCLPEESNFGNYQELTSRWWDIHLNDNGDEEKTFCDLLKTGNWETSTNYLCLP